jgi:hypothetical protein
MTSINANADTAIPAISEPVRASSTLQRLAAGLLWGLAALGSSLLAALVATWPLAANLATAVPRGTERESTVQVLNIWTLWWTADRLTHGFAGYWDAPFFYPFAGVFTFSEPQPLTGVLVAPLWGTGASPALIYNIALLALLTLNGIFAYRLARALDLPRLAALLAGVLTVTLPFVGNMLGVIHLVPLFGMLWTLEGVVRFGKSGELRDATWAALGYLATYLTSQQYALMFGLFAVAAGIVALGQQRFKRMAILKLAGQALAAGALVFLLAQSAIALHTELGFQRPEQVVKALSARPADFLTRPGTALVPLPPANGQDTAGLFPGVLLLALAVTGAITGVRARREVEDPEDGESEPLAPNTEHPTPNTHPLARWAWFLSLSFIAAILLAMGLNIDIFGFQPFEWMRIVVPGFSELRSPFRFAAIMQLVLPLLAAIALADYAQRYARIGVGLVVGLALLASIENLTVPGPMSPVPTTPRTDWTHWLHTQSTVAVVAHVPFPAGVRVADYEIETWRMFSQIDHKRLIINGYSGFFPPGYTEFQLDMAKRFPTQDLLCELNKNLDVDFLVVDQSWLATHKPQMDAQASFLTPAYNDAEVQIYRLQAPQGVCVVRKTTP